MTTRVEGGVTYSQTFDAENRLIAVTADGQTTQFVYDGDGQLVKQIGPDGTTTVYIGGLYEVRTAGGGGPTPTATPTATLTPTATPPGGTRLKDITFEGGSLTHPASGADDATGAMVIESASPLKGGYSARLPNAASSVLIESFPATDDLYVSFYVKVHALPASNLRLALVDTDSGTVKVGVLILRATGMLALTQDGVPIGVEAGPLAAGTLYRVGLRQKRGTGADGVLEAYLAEGDTAFGAPFAATTLGTWTASADRLRVGSSTSNALDATFEHIRLDTGAMPGPSGGGGPTPIPTASPTASPTPPPGGTHTTCYYALPGATGLESLSR